MIPTDQGLFELLTDSYARVLNWHFPNAGAGAGWLYEEAPYAVLAHGEDPDPKFIYANRMAQRLFGYDWDEFLALPSRLSAPEADQAGRGRTLAAVDRAGFVAGYGGTRVTKCGRLFRIEDALIWQLIDNDGRRRGQAAIFGA